MSLLSTFLAEKFASQCCESYTHFLRMQTKKLTTFTTLLPLLGLMLAHLTNDMYGNILPVLVPLLKTKFELSHTMIGIMSAAYTATGSFLQLFFGYLSDRLRHWRFTIIGPLITGFFMSFLGIMPSYELLLLALTMAALGTAMFHPQGTSTAGRLFTKNRGLYVSLFIASGTLGFALGPIFMALVVEHRGIESTPLALIPLAGLVILFTLLQRNIPPEPPPTEAPTGEPTSDRPIERDTRKIISMALLWGIVVFRHTIKLAFITFYILLLQEQGITYLTASFMLFVVLAAGPIGGVLGGIISDRLGRWQTAVFTLVFGFLSMLGFLVFPEPFAYISLLLGTALLNASNPVIIAFAQEISPGRASTASSIVMGVGWGVGAMLVSIVGVIADASSISNALWVSTLTAFVITCALIFAGHFLFGPKRRTLNSG